MTATVPSDTPGTVTLTSRSRRVIWTFALAVTTAAVTATAHGLYEVAVISTVPAAVACLYPVITDGLALVAYAATRRLTRAGRRYAWTVVVLAAALSGVAQAVSLALSVTVTPGWLRFGVGAWPAIAAVIAAHLVYLLAPRGTTAVTPATVPVAPPTAVVTPEATSNESPVSLHPSVSPRPRPVSPRPVTTPAASDTAAQVARLRAAGDTFPVVAQKLGISERTAKRHAPRGTTPSSVGPAADSPPVGPAGSNDPAPTALHSLHSV
jgi:hypothetical protein